MVFISKVFRLNDNNEIYIIGKSITLENQPAVASVVRADLHIGGWRIKNLGDNKCKVTFSVHTDFKVPLFLTRQVAPKSANITLSLRNYILR